MNDVDFNYIEHTDRHVHSFHSTGIAVIKHFLTPRELDSLRSELDDILNSLECDVAQDLGCILETSRFEHVRQERLESASSILTRLKTLASHFLPKPTDSIHLRNEQYIVKPPFRLHGDKAGFVWHHDNQYLTEDNIHDQIMRIPSVSCWVALDDMTPENGCIFAIPYDRNESVNQSSLTLKHSWTELDSETFCQIHHTGRYKNLSSKCVKIPLAVPAGSIICMSGYVLHASGKNLTSRYRRAYMPQFITETA